MTCPAAGHFAAYFRRYVKSGTPRRKPSTAKQASLSGQIDNPHHRPLQLVAEITSSFDNLRQHLTIRVRKVGQYLDQIFLVGQIAYHLSQRKQIGVRVNFVGQLSIGVTHQFHGDSRIDPVTLQIGSPMETDCTF
jgi:hypothetical protein